MNEVRALVEAFDAAVAGGDRCALATIVSVEGSSYRRPGARMLISEVGATTGSISAGCLENDVVEHARRVIRTGEAKLVEYDNGSTTDEMAWGLGLGCNGIVRVLVEPVAAGSPYMEALRQSLQIVADAPHVLAATVYQHTQLSSEVERIIPGSRLLISGQGDVRTEMLNGSTAAMLSTVRTALDGITSTGDLSVEISGGTARVFVEKLLPPVPLVIFGAGQDALPIVELSRGLGWQTEIVDPQARDATRERFAIADRVTLARPDDIAGQVGITPHTMALVMSHNYNHDLEALRFLLASTAGYIGVMGPRKRTERMLADLCSADETLRLDGSHLNRIYSPVGLDIGANGPAEIAISIVAEMRAVLKGKRGGMLRESRGPIQRETSRAVTSSKTKNDGGRVAAVILAAGSSSRMGRPKQTLKFEDISLLRRSVQAAIGAGCSPVIVVTGANAEHSRAELDGLEVREVWNPRWETGMGSSIGAGISELLDTEPQTSAAVVMLCDQPYVTADVISQIVSDHHRTQRSIVGARYGGGIGVPALFHRSHFDELAGLKGASGAKSVIARHTDTAHFIDLPQAEVDVDTPDDYERLTGIDLGDDGRRVARSTPIVVPAG
jgi:xanthine/CO dehydrogenase XdhC/CoxF family maturation factor/CTP:molybdopterin cytidylyltransferase MocA